MAGASGKSTQSRSGAGRIAAAWLRRLSPLALLVPLAAAVAEGCGLEDPYHQGPPIGSGGGLVGSGGSSSTSGAPGVCTDGEKRDCHVTIGEHNGVLTCYSGTEVCEKGQWSPCGDGTITNQMSPEPPPSPEERRGAGEGEGLEPWSPPKVLSLSDAGSCNNKCDPTCQGYNENPDGGILLDGSTNTPWSVGSSISLTATGLTSKGLKTPCYTGADCQYDNYCSNPETPAACTHDKCAVGAPLLGSCEPYCVGAICQQAPQCCLSGPPPAGCIHDVCVTGGALPLGTCSDPCVAKVCQAKPSCCTGTWDASCVALVPAQCSPKTCPAWSQTCVNLVHDVCNAFCSQPTGSCAHDVCLDGAALAAQCDDPDPAKSCVSKICSTYPSCCNANSGKWDALCVSAVASVCSKGCAPQGFCKPWLPGQIDTACSSYDLTAGPACVPAGNPVNIPVCNVGTAPSPAGVQVEWFPANSGNLDPAVKQTDPSYMCAAQNNQKLCTDANNNPVTVGSIQPGQCVNFACQNLNVNGNYELRVNPPPNQKPNECQCMNNWTIVTGGACEPPNCAGAIAVNPVKRPVMMFMVDRSSFVSSADYGSIQSAIATYWSQASSSGIQAALGFYPDDQGNNAVCTTANCGNPANCLQRAGFTALPTNANTVNNAFSSAGSPAGNAPTSMALDGSYIDLNAFESAQTALQQSRDAPVVVFFVGGDPAYCATNLATLAGQAATAAATGRRTFVIGVGGVSQATIDAIAIAGNGKSYPVGTGANVQANVLAALDDIRKSAFTCSFDLPPAGYFDPSVTPTAKILVQNQAPVTLTFVQNAGQCGNTNGFYFSNYVNGIPTKIQLCPASCALYGGNINNTLNITIGCPKTYLPTTYTQQYTASCPQGTTVQWGYLTYDTTTPNGTSVDFLVSTGATLATLGAPVKVATAAQGMNPVCQAPGCFVDLYNKLGLPADQQPVLQLDLKLNPNLAQTLTPTVNGWQITYSCPDSE